MSWPDPHENLVTILGFPLVEGNGWSPKFIFFVWGLAKIVGKLETNKWHGGLTSRKSYEDDRNIGWV